MNPFDLPGPEFLALWLAGCLAVVLVVFTMREVVARSKSRESYDEIAARLHATEIAYLIGGMDRALEAAVTGLHHRGYIAVEGDTLCPTGKTGEAVLHPHGVFRGVIVREGLSRVESYVLDRLPATMDSLRSGAASLDIVLRRQLEEQGLLVENPRRATHLVRAPAYLWIGVGLVKLFVGLSRDRPVSIIFILLAVASVLVFLIKPPRVTSLGRQLGAHLADRYAALEATARTAPQQLDATDMTLAYGVFGYAVAPVVLMTMMPSYHAAIATAASSGGSSCGSSCSSCGGGCGGGCGGCS